jgi:hypothetical protein
VQEKIASENKGHGWNNCQIKKVKRATMVPVYAIKKCGVRKVLFHSFLTSVADRGKKSASHTSCCPPIEPAPLYPQDIKFDSPKASLDALE